MKKMSENNTSISVPEVDPIFSYGVDIGEINVYLVITRSGKIAVVTLKDRVDEEAYAAQTLTFDTFYAGLELVDKARKAWDRSVPNPFAQLRKDENALLQLAKVLTEFKSGE